MQNIKKYFMTLALLLTAVTGAWAQTAFGVKEITADMLPASWSTDNSAVTADDLAKLGFMEVTKDAAKTWTGAPQKGNVRLVYTLCESVNWVNGEGGYVSSYDSRKGFYDCLDGQRIFITTELTEWSLTPDADKKVWTLTNMPANNIELQVEYEPTKVTMAANDKTMGTVEVSGENKVEWTADTWKGWTSSTKEYTVGDITMISTNNAYILEYTDEGKYKNSLNFFVNQTYDNSTVTFSTTGDPFSRIEFTMIDDYAEDKYFSDKWQGNPTIMPKDNWTFSGKSAVWEGEATKSLTLQSCSTWVSKITFFKGATPDGVTVNDDGTFTVAKTATVTLTATPAEGYKFLYWDDDHSNTNPVREVTIESGMADKTYKAVFAEPTYNVTFVEGTNLNEWTATPNTEVKKDTKVDIKYNGAKKVLGMKVEKKAPALTYPIALSAVTSDYIGSVVTTDGNIYATVAAATAASKTPVAMIAYVGTASDCDHGLAIALEDVSNEQLTWNNSGSNNDNKTAAEWCSAWNTSKAVTGGTWRLPSIKDWQYMFIGCGASGSYSDNPSPMSYSGLASKLTTVQGDALQGDASQAAGYWSSTESTVFDTHALHVALDGSNANFYAEFKDGLCQVRACLAF